ncbi:MAG: hypothetical protein Q6358_15340, partial [Candidatus Brocadiales bacterium]|nr:hypothetical protein [Candidatus Brocadiales bacterium]
KNKNKRPHSIDDLKLLLQEAEGSASKKFTIYAKAGILAAILTILIIPVMLFIFFLSNKSEIPQLPVVAVKSKSNRSTEIMNNSDRESNKQERQSQTIKQDIAGNLPGDNTEQKTTDDNKYYNKVVANVQKYDINKETKNIVLKPDPREVLKNEIQAWLQTYKNAWEKGDIETLKKLGHITSEEEEDKLRNHYMYVRDIKVSIQNEVIEINDDNRQTTVSFDRTDEWTDERGERHKENLPRIVKTLHKENNIWKIVK